ncbi:HerA helicase [Thermoproteus tenax Kra 1]|uniref:HerA helicase n=1 Tax=Thermoproteus tenax (strain ATCC 35583 / DSM 2078 / JCM 9277 / NBRC 100435 / Kra 1) TaxID=768679 RepID=G4RNV8_THETK|nr:HerA helicase [Thermoproteus tenax Kra 1]
MLLPLVLLLILTLLWREGEVLIGIGGAGLLYLPLDKHITIIGPTRSGKTRLAKKIAKRSGAKVIVLDWNGEYDLGLRVKAQNLKINISKLNKKILVELIGLSINLNEPSIYFMYRAIRDYQIKSPRDLIRALDSYLTTTKSETEMKAAILRRLEYVFDIISNGKINVEKIVKSRRSFTIDLSDLSLVEEKVLISSLILTYIYNYFRKSNISKKIKLIIIMEESQNLVNAAIIRHLFAEIAKYGVRVVMVSNVIPPPEMIVHSNVVIVKPHTLYDLKINKSSIIINDKIYRVYKFL